jgi:hypothetical protein
MTEPREVELWLCGYTAICSASACGGRATTILRYVGRQGRPDRHTNACDIHTSQLCAELKVIDRRRCAGKITVLTETNTSTDERARGLKPAGAPFRKDHGLFDR